MNVNPVAFYVFGVPIYWYGVVISLGLILGTAVAFARTEKYGISQDELLNFALVAVPAGVIGARLAFVIINWDSFAGNWRDMINIRLGGLSIHGAILAAIIVCILFSWIRKLNFWTLADICAPALILGQAVGRWGNYFNQEAYGVPTDLPWALYIDGEFRHPIFFYEFAWNLIVFAYLIYISKKVKMPGGIFLRYLIGYSVGRFFIEWLRADTLYWGSLRAGQVMSVIFIVAALVLLLWRKRRFAADRKGEENK